MGLAMGRGYVRNILGTARCMLRCRGKLGKGVGVHGSLGLPLRAAEMDYRMVEDRRVQARHHRDAHLALCAPHSSALIWAWAEMGLPQVEGRQSTGLVRVLV